ncbi:MAG: zinc-ribbon domain-containing protein [Candidatus Bathyarchaeia archaeon]
MESLEKSLEEKKRELKEVSSRFAGGEIEEGEYLGKVKALSEEITRIKTRIEEERKSQLRSVVGVRVFVKDELLGTVSEVALDDKGPLLRISEPVGRVEAKPVVKPEERKCPNCGAKLREGAKFCVQCGTKV